MSRIGPQIADVEPLADDHDAPAIALELADHVLAKLGQGQARLGQVDLDGQLPLGVGQPGRGRNEADLPAHRLDDQHRVGGRGAGVLLVGLTQVMGVVARHRAVAGRMVEEGEFRVAQVIVDGLGHAGGDEVEPPVGRELADLVGRVLRVVAADVEEVADVVGLEDIDDALEIEVLPFLQLVAAGADAPGGRRGPQEGDLLLGGRREVEQVLP